MKDFVTFFFFLVYNIFLFNFFFVGLYLCIIILNYNQINCLLFFRKIFYLSIISPLFFHLGVSIVTLTVILFHNFYQLFFRRHKMVLNALAFASQVETQREIQI